MEKRSAKTLSTGTLERSIQIDRTLFNKEARTVRVRFSSETPVKRWFGEEILSHTPEAVDLTRMKDGAAVLMEHEPAMRCGITETASITADKTGEAVIRFARTPLGDQCLTEIEDGTLRWLSVGYTVDRFEVDENEETYTATRWTPLEVSLVSIPADPTCKVLRSNGRAHESMIMKRSSTLHDATAPDGNGAPSVITEDDFSREMDEGLEILKLAAQYQRDYPELVEASQRAIKDKWGIRKWQAHLLKVTAKPATARGAEIIASANRNGGRADMSLGGRFVNSERYQETVKRGFGKGRHVEIEIPEAYGFNDISKRVTFGIGTSDVSTSTDLAGTSGAGIDIIRQPWNLLNQQPIAIADLFAQGSTTGDVVRYIRELSFTNAAARVAEASGKPQAQFDVGVINATVEKTAVYVDVSEEMMNDWQQAGSFINSRLSYMVQAAEDSYLLNGSGSNQITGILNFSGIQSVSGATSTVDQLLRAKAYVEGANGAGFAMPDAYVMNPLDFLNVRLSKDSNGQYLFGGPAYSPYGTGGFTNVGSLWGLPVVTSTFLAQGTALVGAFRMGAQIFRRAGVTIRTTDSDGSKFLSNIMTVVAESRFTLACYQPNRFCTITSIPAAL